MALMTWLQPSSFQVSTWHVYVVTSRQVHRFGPDLHGTSKTVDGAPACSLPGYEKIGSTPQSILANIGYGRVVLVYYGIGLSIRCLMYDERRTSYHPLQ